MDQRDAKVTQACLFDVEFGCATLAEGIEASRHHLSVECLQSGAAKKLWGPADLKAALGGVGRGDQRRNLFPVRDLRIERGSVVTEGLYVFNQRRDRWLFELVFGEAAAATRCTTT